jgi:hypothetical protein
MIANINIISAICQTLYLCDSQEMLQLGIMVSLAPDYEGQPWSFRWKRNIQEKAWYEDVPLSR